MNLFQKIEKIAFFGFEKKQIAAKKAKMATLGTFLWLKSKKFLQICVLYIEKTHCIQNFSKFGELFEN